MQETSAFGLQRIEGPAARSSLLYLNQPTPVIVDGLILEKQLKVGQKYLLLLTDDCPYEEVLSIYLIDNDCNILDALELGKPYTPGILGKLAILGENKLEFSFFGKDCWRLEIMIQPSWRYNRPLFPVRYKKGLIARRHLLLSESK